MTVTLSSQGDPSPHPQECTCTPWGHLTGAQGQAAQFVGPPTEACLNTSSCLPRPCPPKRWAWPLGKEGHLSQHPGELWKVVTVSGQGQVLTAV